MEFSCFVSVFAGNFIVTLDKVKGTYKGILIWLLRLVCFFIIFSVNFDNPLFSQFIVIWKSME